MGFGATLRNVSARLAADLASILKQERGSVRGALELRLAAEERRPSIDELLELRSRAERQGSTPLELLLAVGTLLALHAAPAGAVRR